MKSLTVSQSACTFGLPPFYERMQAEIAQYTTHHTPPRRNDLSAGTERYKYTNARARPRKAILEFYSLRDRQPGVIAPKGH